MASFDKLAHEHLMSAIARLDMRKYNELRKLLGMDKAKPVPLTDKDQALLDLSKGE